VTFSKPEVGCPGGEEEELEGWKRQLQSASAEERASEEQATQPGRGSWKPSMGRAIPSRGRQHGSSNALNLMNSLSPRSYDVNDAGWLPR
jgi:hypothetical protein